MTPAYKQLRSMVLGVLARGEPLEDFLAKTLAKRDEYRAEREALDARRLELTETIGEFDTIVRILRQRKGKCGEGSGDGREVQS